MKAQQTRLPPRALLMAIVNRALSLYAVGVGKHAKPPGILFAASRNLIPNFHTVSDIDSATIIEH